MSTTLTRNQISRKSPMRQPAARSANVGTTERVASVVGGAALLFAGILGSQRVRAVALASGSALLYRGLSGNCLLYRALGVDRSSEHSQAVAVKHRQGVHFARSILIGQPPEVIFGFWRNLSRLPMIVDHLESVIEKEDGRSRWTARGPLDVSMEWEAEIIDERPNEFLAWRSISGGDVDTAGSIHLQALPHDRGTVLRLVMKYDPPGGVLTARLASWFGTDVESELFEGLRRMKQLLETGETPTTEDQPMGSCRSSVTRGRKP